MKKNIFIKAIIAIIFCAELKAQNEPLTDTIEYEGIFTVIEMDSFIITATRMGFDVEDFIIRVRKDESFYRAFRNLRFLNYDFNNDIKFFDKKNREKATYQSQAQQLMEANCRSMVVKNERVTGNFLDKKRRYNYYTAKLYDRLFFTHGKVCGGGEPTEASLQLSEDEKGMEKYVTELKKLIFKPGEKADVPFIGKKTAIFDPKMMPYYNFSISAQTYQSKHDCYVFTAALKPEFETNKENETVVKYLETFFEKQTMRVIARRYKLKYSNLAYNFDVSMNVELSELANGKLVPIFIRYDGVWDVPLQKPEKSIFEIRFANFSNKND